MKLPHTFKRIRLHLARSKEFPSGSSRHGYEFVVPLDANGHIDATLWKVGGLGLVLAGQIPHLNLTPGQRQSKDDERGNDPDQDQDTHEGHGSLLSMMEDDVLGAAA